MLKKYMPISLEIFNRKGQDVLEYQRIFLTAMLENMNTGVVACNEKGELVLFNRIAREWHGLDPLNIPQTEWANYYNLYMEDGITPMDIHTIPLLRGFRGETIHDVGMVIALKNKPKRYFHCYASPIKREDGKILGAIAVFNDITEQKIAENILRDSERNLKESQAIAGIGSYVLDIPQGIWSNSELLDEIFGIDRAFERTVDGWGKLIHPDDRQMMLDHFNNDVLGRKQHFDKEYRILRHNDNTMRWVHGKGRLELDPQGNPSKMIGTIQDITERKHIVEELKFAKDQAEVANKYKTEFLTNISHDLRTPLNAILGFAHILKSAEIDEKYRKSVDFINERGKHLMGLIDDILDVSKLDSGNIKVKSDEFDLIFLIKNSIESFRINTIRKDVVISLNVEGYIPSIKGDVLKVEQIFDNLLSNAVKYTPKGSIKVNIKVDERQPNDEKCRLELSVKDTGIGIPADKLPFIYDSFTRFHEFYKGETYEGSGLGLHIVQKLVTFMGGEIRVSSKLDVGSEFIVIFNFDRV